MPEVIGKGMGQLHDDITEVNGGKIIRAVFVRPKLYILEIIGYSKEEPDKLVIVYHSVQRYYKGKSEILDD